MLVKVGLVSKLSAQSTTPIESSILEVRYIVTHKSDKDMFALRCGKNVSQYFSVGKLRDDSLRASPDPTVSIVTTCIGIYR